MRPIPIEYVGTCCDYSLVPWLLLIHVLRPTSIPEPRCVLCVDIPQLGAAKNGIVIWQDCTGVSKVFVICEALGFSSAYIVPASGIPKICKGPLTVQCTRWQSETQEEQPTIRSTFRERYHSAVGLGGAACSRLRAGADAQFSCTVEHGLGVRTELCAKLSARAMRC